MNVIEPTWRTEDGAIRLYLGDCLDVLPTLEAGSVDAVVTDLPYGTTNCEWDSVIPLEELWLQYLHVTTQPAAMVLLAQTPFDKVLGCSKLRWLRYEWIWHKTEPTGHLNAKRMPMKSHENILVFYRTLPVYNPQKTNGHERKTATARRHEDGSPIYGEQRGTTTYDATDRYPRSVITFPTDKQTCNLHPTQKPVALMKYLVCTYTERDYTVLDNAMGSATTGVACIRTGRKFIGIEKEPKYFQIAVDRITKELERNALFEPKPKIVQRQLIQP